MWSFLKLEPKGGNVSGASLERSVHLKKSYFKNEPLLEIK